MAELERDGVRLELEIKEQNMRQIDQCGAVRMTSVGLVTKHSFGLPEFRTCNGNVLKNVCVGYEAYGELNASADNAILICHHFSGTSHAAGKYEASDTTPGYWDDIIGPGKPIDTTKYFVLSSDTLVNLNAKDPRVITTGPATTNPETGRPYGMGFPVVSIRDFVNVQKALLESLGIHRLAAVAGPSGGAVQAVEWAAAYPNMVERVIAVVSPGLEIDAYGIAAFDAWNTPILMDPNWLGGDYYGHEEPVNGVARALGLVTLGASGHGELERQYGRKWAPDGNSPAASPRQSICRRGSA